MAHFLTALVLAAISNGVLGDSIEVCNAELNARIRCRRNEIIVVTSAEYGRKSLGRCITEANQFMGCTNDVLPVVDRWCSGRRECELRVPHPELEHLNKNCLKVLIKYLSVQYDCVPVNSDCSNSRPTSLSAVEGMISSSSRDLNDCGSPISPWIISAQPGQTINISVIDFGSGTESSNLVRCPVVYGYVGEKRLGINQTICSGQRRERALYSSKTNIVTIEIVPKNKRGDKNFLLKYFVTGCAEMSRPAHAWYRREGNQAVIGCENNDKEWRLVCIGNTWKGEIGNCTETGDTIVMPKVPEDVATDSVVIMTGIVGGALVFCVVAVVIGTVYVKKYRMRQETKYMTKAYATLGDSTQMSYGPVDLNLIDQATLNKMATAPWDGSRDQMASYPPGCTCSSIPSHGGGGDERQSLYSSIKSS